MTEKPKVKKKEDDEVLKETAKKVSDRMTKTRRQIVEVTNVEMNSFRREEFLLAERVAGYMKGMAVNKPVSPEEASSHQKSLFSTLLMFLSVDRERFTVMMDWLLAVIRESRAKNGVFSDRYVGRYYSQMDIAPDRLRAYSRLLNLLLVASGTFDRSIVARRVDIDAVLESFKDKEIKEKLLIYFGSTD